ncbi:MAG: TlpA disulfide reductase family protein [Opitutaceae bacterium]
MEVSYKAILAGIRLKTAHALAEGRRMGTVAGMTWRTWTRLFLGLVLSAFLAGLADLRAAFVLSGQIPAPLRGDGQVEVERESLEARSTQRVASAQLESGAFTLSVEAEAGLFRLRVGATQMAFVAGKGQHLKVVGTETGRDLKLEGGPDQLLFMAYESLRAASLQRHVLSVRQAIQAARSRGDSAQVDRLTEAEVEGYRTHRRELVDFTISRLTDSPALYAASLRWDGDHRRAELATVVRAFIARNPGLEISRLMEDRLRGFEATALGAEAPPLAGTGPSGGEVSLAGLRGKVVLVDFWASWCAPCRSENRHYAALYEKYRGAGFEILAVSVDHDARAWKSAIEKDRAAWLHVSDLSGWRSPLAARYQVTALPASFLLDREGRIVAKDLRSSALAAELERRLRSP